MRDGVVDGMIGVPGQVLNTIHARPGDIPHSYRLSGVVGHKHGLLENVERQEKIKRLVKYAYESDQSPKNISINSDWLQKVFQDKMANGNSDRKDQDALFHMLQQFYTFTGDNYQGEIKDMGAKSCYLSRRLCGPSTRSQF